MKNSKAKKILALVLAALMIVATVASCGEKKEEYKGADTLVVGYSNFSQKFSPFFAESAYDVDVYTMTQLGLLGTDREGNPVLKGIEGETIAYNGKDYTYKGIANCEIKENSDGTVDYNITMRDDVKFSDGEPMTIDDAIFSLYVFCDPTYDGSSTMSSLPIVGIEEYKSGMLSLFDIAVAKLAADAAAAEAGDAAAPAEGEAAAPAEDAPATVDYSKYITDEQVNYFKEAFNKGGAAFAQNIVDYCVPYGATDVKSAAALWGFELADGATVEDFFAKIFETYGYNVSDKGINAEVAGTKLPSISSCIKDALGDRLSEFEIGAQTGDSASNIAGVKKTGDYSMTVSLSKVDATAIYQMGWVVAPLHYYGDKNAYNYDNNQFGFVKGDLSGVKSKTTKPMGAGPYKFVSYENGTVTFERNENYYKGAPKIKNVLFKESSDADKLTGVATGTLDISDPSISDATVKAIKEYNGGEMSGKVIETNSVDNLGYGYIGICSKRVNVGGDIGSTESKNLRKGFATLFSVYRDTAINSYYGERAAVIQYPISNTSWAAPKPADDGYEIAYSKDVDGKPIYTDGMTDEEKFAAALQAAIGYFKAAGYTWDDAANKFTAAPDGAALTYEIQIPGDGVGDHPAFGIVTNAANALKNIGIDLQVNDLSDSSGLWDALDANTVDMWTAAWGAAVDPDMYQVYHSSSVAGAGGSNSNHYCIMDENLDKKIVDARSSLDKAYRKAVYKECLDIVLDWACEIPIYQRQNVIIFSAERVNLETVTPDITTFWGWMNDLEALEMQPAK